MADIRYNLTATEALQVSKSNQPGSLVVQIVVGEQEGYQSVKDFTAYFTQKLESQKKGVKIGHAQGFIVDPQLKNDDSKTPVWIQELLLSETLPKHLRKDGYRKDGTSELRYMASFICTKAGKVRARFQKVADQLPGAAVVSS